MFNYVPIELDYLYGNTAYLMFDLMISQHPSVLPSHVNDMQRLSLNTQININKNTFTVAYGIWVESPLH